MSLWKKLFSKKEEVKLYSVTLIHAGSQKVAVIKEVRILTGLGLKEAKYLVDMAPSILLESCSADRIFEIERAFKEAGASLEMDPV